MKTKHLLQCATAVIISLCSFAQTTPKTPKTLRAKRTTANFKIDGNLDEPAWKDAPAALGYTEFRPTPWKIEDPAIRTEAYLLYSDEGIYFGGYCHERTKDSISAELNGRDGFGNNDYIGIIFDTYDDKINGFEYFVTPYGDQMDARMSPNPNGNSEDFTWNAVWKSAAVIHDDGWSFEIFLPFSAIRFSKKNIQDWGMNITRRRQKTGQQNTWNPIDVNVNGFLTQEGLWTGLENIQPPLRLQFYPYFSTYLNNYPTNVPGEKSTTTSFNGGMDVKYGISQALTLDMTLIPDFGQVQSDNQVLNLTPFEVKYNENRAFFTEGTELFNKGNLFYSRRIGGQPLHYNDVASHLDSNHILISNPSESKIANATKISGRLQNGLGIGFFNAITSPTYAVIEDESKNQQKIQTSPLTNYNIAVLNQSLKYNSSVTLINTNVWRSGSDYDANVVAALFDLNNKKNMWNVGGKFSSSILIDYLPHNKNVTGYNHSLYFGKTSGRFNFNVNEEIADDKFNSNDLGYFTNNNYINHSLWMGYNWSKPTNWYNNIHLNANAFYSQRYKPLNYSSANFNVNANGQLKNLWFVGALVGYEPDNNNYYEPRVPGRVFRGWADWFVDGWVQTDNAKKYQVYIEYLYVDRNLFHSKRHSLTFNHRYRFNNKLSIGQNISYQPQFDNAGFAAITNPDIIFGRRDVNAIENIFNIKYSFTPKIVFTTRIRYYWSQVNNKEYFVLLQNGRLKSDSTFNSDANQNYNTFTVDAVFNWEFAPGSFINFVWKNNATTFDRNVTGNYFKNFDNTMQAPAANSLSLKVIYFLDYLDLKHKKKKE